MKVEVTDGTSFAIFLIFDSEMAYIMEKSCAYFVAQSKVDYCFLSFLIIVSTSLNVLIFYYGPGLQWCFAPK